MSKKCTFWLMGVVAFVISATLGLGLSSSAEASEKNTEPYYDEGTNTLYIPSGEVSSYSIYHLASETHANSLERVVIEGDVTIYGGGEDHEGLFQNCSHLTSFEAHGKVTVDDKNGAQNTETLVLSFCFSGCSSLKSIDLSMFNTDKALTVSGIFSNCTQLEEANLSSFNLEANKEINGAFGYMFYNCVNLKKVNMGTCCMSDELSIDPDNAGTFAIESGDAAISNQTLSNITMDSDFNLVPGTLDEDETPIGSFFNYDHPEGWNAYYNGVFQENLHTYEDFVAYKASHPGLSTYVWPDAPQPEPEQGEWIYDPETNTWKYKNPDGSFVTGFKDITEEDGVTYKYFFNEEGILIQGQWIWDPVTQKWYWATESGAIAQNMWAWAVDAWYYFEDGGAMHTGWIWDGAWYYCESNGAMVKGIWDWIDNEWYGFWWDGKMCTGWVWDSAYVAWYYCFNNGVCARNSWVWDTNWYYMNNNCQMVTSAWIDGYYLNWRGIWV